MYENKENNISSEDVDTKFRIEGNTLIFNDGIEKIEACDLHYISNEEEIFLKPEFKNLQKIILPDS